MRKILACIDSSGVKFNFALEAHIQNLCRVVQKRFAVQQHVNHPIEKPRRNLLGFSVCMLTCYFFTTFRIATPSGIVMRKV